MFSNAVFNILIYRCIVMHVPCWPCTYWSARYMTSSNGHISRQCHLNTVLQSVPVYRRYVPASTTVPSTYRLYTDGTYRPALQYHQHTDCIQTVPTGQHYSTINIQTVYRRYVPANTTVPSTYRLYTDGTYRPALQYHQHTVHRPPHKLIALQLLQQNDFSPFYCK